MSDTDETLENGANGEEQEEPRIKVEDKRHWAREDRDEESGDDDEPTSTVPTIIDEYRQRAEAAETKLHEYIEAFKASQAEQDQFRERLNRDVERRVSLQFSGLVGELLESIDNLDLALSHAEGIPEAKPLADGVAMVRSQFLASLTRQGVEQIQPEGEEFDPEVAEALSLVPVQDPAQNNKVLQTMRPGYRMGDQVVRPARVVVGKFSG
ncbi:hypothetical protein ABI59_22950 [Acidobacteria bacterium Mor1]|nr:hypothetical protein ABI59_22950 [Acidobacteria bacterium Mor1]